MIIGSGKKIVNELTALREEVASLRSQLGLPVEVTPISGGELEISRPSKTGEQRLSISLESYSMLSELLHEFTKSDSLPQPKRADEIVSKLHKRLTDILSDEDGDLEIQAAAI